MRTNIVLNEQLVQEAFSYAKVGSKRELIDLALHEFVLNHRRLDLRDLPGTVKLRKDYDYKNLRSAN
jgi:Arc/MetJ family transcription regulator